ncbi:hypothetical protein ANN_14235 [Periplaneta americana]|uniref:MADF domain-containing protein n=1 Tax=Periplaneta americana TaxID=6978 RepID=A0ABQ8SVS0_PERAM|nr:hypothetical protein ANN_14235 [Periplaneta americana]
MVERRKNKESKRDDWYDDECRVAKKMAEEALRVFIRVGNDESRIRYVQLRRNYKDIIQLKKTNWELRKAGASPSDIRTKTDLDIHKRKVTEYQKIFPVRGHSYCQCDRNFAMYSKKLKRKSRVATGPDYDNIISFHYYDFRDFVEDNLTEKNNAPLPQTIAKVKENLNPITISGTETERGFSIIITNE